MKKQEGDLVLQEIWRNKDELSAARGHGVPRRFADARKRQTLSAVKIHNAEAAKVDAEWRREALDVPLR